MKKKRNKKGGITNEWEIFNTSEFQKINVDFWTLQQS